MKKNPKLNVFAVATSVLLAFGLTSCKKYTCKCTTVYKHPYDEGYSTYPVKKKDRKKLCTDKSTSHNPDGSYTTCIII